ncbi:MAG: autotransporter assembly complex family protein, partial [Pseudohongiellaceae bacterium]
INISILGDEAPFADLLEGLPVASGDQLNHGLYEQIKSDLSAGAIQNGYFDARFTSSRLLLDLNQRLADIEIEFDPQQRHRFGEVEIQRLDELDEDFIRRFVNIEPGSPYSANALIELRNTLNESLYFSDVSVSPALDRTVDTLVPVDVSLQARPRHVYGIGAGVTTDIGPRLRLDYQDRYLNRRGHNINARVATSPIQQEVDLNYIIPMTRPAFESLRLSTGVLNQNNDSYENRTLKIGAAYSRLNRFDFRQNYFINYQHDEFRINEQDEVADLFILGSNVTRTRADDAIYPTAGWRAFAELRGASRSLLSTTSFTQLYGSGKFVQQLGVGRLLAKVDAGVSWVEDLNELPVSVQFFAGGDQSVRGYKYQSLGPLNDAGELIGGRHLLVFGLEYDFSVLPTWKLAVFADAGNAFNTLNDFELKTGAGIGLRWLSPIGPVRLDLASALDDDNSLRVHITMGPDL